MTQSGKLSAQVHFEDEFRTCMFTMNYEDLRAQIRNTFYAELVCEDAANTFAIKIVESSTNQAFDIEC